jgi:N-acetylglucosaminyl-diphospho-decaprenol L-rhamnosyltransferase
VVNYNAKDDLLTCVASLLGEGVETVVVADNGSTDGSEAALSARYPDVKWAPTGSNLGYGAAADLGAAMCDSTYLLICNPDVVVESGSVAILRRFLEARPQVAVVGPRIVDRTGALYPSARRFPDLVEALGHGFLGQFWPGNPFSRRYRMSDWDHASARQVDWVSGACFLVRRTAWEAVGGFDRAYFMYLEDVDLCWRLGRTGWGVAYEPTAHVVHVQGVSADRHPYRMLLAHHVSMWRFARRSTPPGRRWALPFVLPGLAVRLGLTVARRALSGLLSRGRPVPVRAER